jgi:DNA primase
LKKHFFDQAWSSNRRNSYAGTGSAKWRTQQETRATSSSRASLLGSGIAKPEIILEQALLAGLVLHPELLDDFADALEGGFWAVEDHVRLADALLTIDPAASRAEARETLEARLGPEALESVLGQRHVRISPATRGNAADARLCVHDALSRLAARRGADRERREALEDFEEGADEALTWRLAQASRRTHEAARAPRSVDVNEDETAGMSDYLQGLLDKEVWKKRPRK